MAAPAAYGQQSNLRVIVSSAEDGNAVSGANLILTTTADDTVGTGVTDMDGMHQFTGLPGGDLILEVRFLGFEPYRSSLFLQPDETRNYHVDLEADVEELEELIVEADAGATRRRAGLQRVSVSDIGRIPSPGPGDDLAMYLQSMPGVVSGGDRGGEFFVRGGTPDQTMVTVDNLNVIRPFHISSLFSVFPGEALQSVEMYSGGFGAEYMGATSAVMDVRLRPGNMQEYSGRVAASPYMVSGRAEGPLQAGRTSFLGVVRASVIEQTAPHISSRDETPLRFMDLTGRYSVRQDNINCNVTGLYSHDSGQINPVRDEWVMWSNTALGGRCLMFNEELNYTYDLSGGFTRFHNTEGPVGQEPEREASFRMIYLNLDTEIHLFGLPVRYGGRISYDLVDTFLDERFGHITTRRNYYTNISGYTGTRWEPFDQLTFEPSVGTQLVNAHRARATIEPRMRLTWRPGGGDRQEISLAGGKYNQMMSGITDERDAGTVFYVYEPVRDADPLPFTLQAILGYRQQVIEGVEFNVEGYTMEHRNQPVSRWTIEAQPEVNTALANGRTYGLETRLELDRHPLYVFLGHDWSEVVYESAVDDLGAWIGGNVFRFHPAHDRRHQFNVLASYQLAGVTGSVRWEASTGNPFTRIRGFDLALNQIPDEDPREHPGTARVLYDRPYDGRLPAYQRLDVSLERGFRLSERSFMNLKVGTVNTLNWSNIFYFDVRTIQRVDQMPLFPYLSMAVEFN